MSTQKKIILSHAGKQHSYHVAQALASLNALDKFYTSSYITPLWLQNMITRSGNTYWSKRYLKGLGGSLVESHWKFELKEIIYGKLFGQTQKTLEAVYNRDVLFDKMVTRKLHKQKGDFFWGFQGSCLNSLATARKLGKKAICELATGHAPAAIRILGEEQRLHPEWADSFDNLQFPKDYLARLEEEPHQADIVIGASQFTLRTLREAGIGSDKMQYLPLGFEIDRIPYHVKDSIPAQRPLKLLYAGRITQRKGIVYLLEAMRSFSKKEVELDIIGFVHGSGNGLRKYKDHYFQHAPLSQYELFKRYSEFDAFVLPSLFEGFGLVIVEAMAAGLPVITTPHSIGPELIKHGYNGYIVPVRDPVAITHSINDLLSKTPDQRLLMRRAARETATQYSWAAYGERLQALINSL